MEVYLNTNGASGITHYEIGTDFITVRIHSKLGLEDYTYTHRVTGPRKIATMKMLARGGKGLGAYIVKDVGKAWASKKLVAA